MDQGGSTALAKDSQRDDFGAHRVDQKGIVRLVECLREARRTIESHYADVAFAMSNT